MARDLKPKTPLAERLVAARLYLQLGRDDLAKALGWNRSTLAKYEQGASQPDFGFLDRLQDGFGISLDWVITGRGVMCPDQDAAQPAAESSAVPQGMDEGLLAAVIEGVIEAHGGELSRLPSPQLGRAIALMYADLVATYDSHADRMVGLRLALRNVCRDLLPPKAPGRGGGKRLV
ncbi:helix-turn-helix transcriptional regulator [Magnetospirillum sp. 15-1]|uniref:helix-turn-helix domain-containing protein n=1 Tax=Magnetospirillum sp. 15-1 TaxID=1979370 RepID=UPI000BBCDEFD|nr:helix-turn-helix transcriptional regulator [Magnetospirillum sp. 15-1]